MTTSPVGDTPEEDRAFLEALTVNIARARATAAAALCDVQLRYQETRFALTNLEECAEHEKTVFERRAEEAAESALAEAMERTQDLDQQAALVARRLLELRRTDLDRVLRDDDVLRADNLARFQGKLTGRQEAALLRATRWLQLAEVFVSPRIAQEEIGDALEDVARFAREGRPAWQIVTHAVVCAVLAVWHAWGDKIAALRHSRG
jgi:hypothetical protein